MRDGLHKGLALGREWQGLAKSCEREAERGGTARERASDALAADTAKELPEDFIERLVKTAEDGASLLPSFSAFTEEKSTRQPHSPKTPLQNEIWANAARLEADGESGRSLAHRAVEDALKDRGQRRLRQIEQHYTGEAAVSRAASAAINSVDVTAITGALLAGEPLRPKRQRRRIDLDEDLTRPQ